MKRASMLVFIIGMMIIINGCVTTSNFYTARTLESGKFAFSLGGDDIYLKSSSSTVTVSKDRPFVFSIGGAYGLPYRFESFIRYYPTHVLEAGLRHQVNPKEFELFDGSLNMTYAHVFDGYSYLKYGVSISKNINEFEPYLHYSQYSFLNGNQHDVIGISVTAVFDDVIGNSRSVGFGIGLPIRKAKLYPEANYQYFGGDTKNGIWHFGVGIRVFAN